MANTLVRDLTSADYIIVAPTDGSDFHLAVLNTESPINVDLPKSSEVKIGQKFIVKCGDGGAAGRAITVRRQESDFIQGASSYTMNVAYGTAEFYWNGQQFVVENSNTPQVLGTDKGGTNATTLEDAAANLGVATQKAPCRFATTGNVGDFYESAPLYVDNVAEDKPVQVGDRILMWQEANTPNNLIYVVKVAGTGSNGTWELASDCATSDLVYSGISTLVTEGDTYADKTFVLVTDNPITIGTTPLTWSASGGGSGDIALPEGQIFVGDGDDIAAPVTMSGDVTIASNGVTTISHVDPGVVKTFIYNHTGSTLTSGTFVALRTNADYTQGVIRADSITNVPATHVVAGIDIADGASGYVVNNIIFASLDTSAAPADGSPIYLDMNGTFTYTEPTDSASIVQEVGYCAKKDEATGMIYYRPGPVKKIGTLSLQNSAVTSAKIASAVTFHLTYTQELIGSITEQKLHAEGGVEGAVVDGATLEQDTSGATATVVTYVSGGQNRFTLTGISGTFDTSHIVTGTNPDTTTFSFTPSETLLDCWELEATPVAFSVIAASSGPLMQTVDGLPLATGLCRFIRDTNQIETLSSDEYSFVGAEFCPSTTASHS